MRLTTQEIAAAWGVDRALQRRPSPSGTPYAKPDGSGRIMVPLQFANPGGAYGVPVGGPVTGLCLEFEEVDDGGTPVPLLADGYQVGDWVLPTTTPQLGYAECPSGITPTPDADSDAPARPTRRRRRPATATSRTTPIRPTTRPSPWARRSGARLDPYGDEDVVHLWVWTGLHLEVLTHSLGGWASTNLEIPTCSGTFYDTDGGEARIEWISACDEVVVMHVTSANGYYGPGETYTLQVNQLP